jgi:protein O-GlcNAc transferase
MISTQARPPEPPQPSGGPPSLARLLELGLAALELGHLQAALETFDRALALKADSFVLLSERARCLFLMGNLGDALQGLTACLAVAGDGDPVAEVYYRRAVVEVRLGRPAQAEEDFRASLGQGLRDERCFAELAALYTGQQRWDEAIELLRRAARLHPFSYEVWWSLAQALVRREREGEALEAFEWAYQAQVGRGEPLLARARLLLQPLDQPERALVELDRAQPLLGDDPALWMTYEQAYSRCNRLEEARQALQRAVELDAGNPDYYSALIFRTDHCKDASLQTSYALRLDYARRFEAPLRAERFEHANQRDPKRRLRVGYVSADFCNHSAAQCFIPVIEAHDPRQVEVFCYSSGTRFDQATRRVQRASSRCYDVRALSDAQLAAQIHKDQIDILVDCSGHTAGNRLQVFAYKPAPVQITAWGYVNGTGLETMDYCLSDAVVLPLEFEPYFRERPLRLSTLLTGEPLHAHLKTAPLPLLGRGYPTLGCFNRYTKITRRTLRLWSLLLQQIPNARLLLKDVAYDNPARVQEVRSVLEAAGVATERVFVWGTTSHLEHIEAYAHLDVALDPFPAGGGRTTLEALWMGVPVITHRGDNLNGRVTASILRSAGLEHLVASTYEEYIAKTRTLLADVEGLRALRQGLRAKLLRTPLYDPKRYTRELEAAYRTVWAAWCQGPPTAATGAELALTPQNPWALQPIKQAAGWTC